MLSIITSPSIICNLNFFDSFSISMSYRSYEELVPLTRARDSGDGSLDGITIFVFVLAVWGSGYCIYFAVVPIFGPQGPQGQMGTQGEVGPPALPPATGDPGLQGSPGVTLAYSSVCILIIPLYICIFCFYNNKMFIHQQLLRSCI
jgi:hypothetical protein